MLSASKGILKSTVVHGMNYDNVLSYANAVFYCSF